MSVLVGKQAPNFSAPAVVNGEEIVEGFSLEQFKGEKYVIFFFYPKDFTFVCPTELHAFQEKLEEFKSKGCEIVACSTDTEESHWGLVANEQRQWRNRRGNIPYRGGHGKNHQHELWRAFRRLRVQRKRRIGSHRSNDRFQRFVPYR
jgi:alkyl hydroperoxide reductase subunit AhpC